MRATTFSTPKVSRATRAEMMLLLSPLLTAAKACARSMPASTRVSRSNPTPVTRCPANSAGSRRKALGVPVDDGHGVPSALEALRQGRADPAAAHDHDVHAPFLPGAGAARSADRRATLHAARRTPPRSAAGPTTLAACRGPSDVLKRVLLGRALRSDRLGETLLPKRIALPVFASDALSSVAYAPDEIFLTLALAGVTAYTFSWKIAIVVAIVMTTVIISYRQNVHAYPSGGGDYEVATTNLGDRAGLIVASALLVDYVLTVAVSISSAAQYAASAVPALNGHEAQAAVAARSSS